MKKVFLILEICFLSFLFSCSNPSTKKEKIKTIDAEYVVFAWNDLGMHCLNPTYDKAVILPPYNNLWAQVVKRGLRPEIVTTGITVEYAILNNTYSYGKTDDFGGNFAQFWDNAQALFGVSPAQDKGLNLRNAAISNGLSGQMVLDGDHFVADGIPVTPVEDSGHWNPYQVAEIKVRDANQKVLMTTRATVPTSDEINCKKCHGTQAFDNILDEHEEVGGQKLTAIAPVLCAKCHGSPALGTSGKGSSGKYLSEAIHGKHSTEGAVCYDCHPGDQTQCTRSKAHTAADGKCVTCHGTLAQVASGVTAGTRTPWVDEPACIKCHSTNIAGVNIGTVLYRNASGHGGMNCAACHGSPHAMIPSNKASDNYQALQYQSSLKTIGSCGACHDKSKGENDMEEFASKHGGANPDVPNACIVCHTAIPSTNTGEWPHQFQWTSR